MSGFTAQALERKLVDLNNSQQSIQTLSLWLIHHRKHHKSIVQTWFAELKKAKPSRRLTFMYLANDVIQNSRKKGPEYSKEFGAVLKASFEVVAKDSDDKTLTSLDRILSIWEQRNIYESIQINSFKVTLSSRKTQQTVKELNNSNNNSNNNNNNNNNININNDSNVKQKDKEKEKNREKRSEHHKKDVHKSSKELKQTNDKKVKDSKKRLQENSKEVIPSKKRSTDESKKSSVISHNETKLKVSKSVDKTEKKTTTTTVVAPIVNTGLGNIVDPEVLIKALQELENSASADAGVRQKIASLPTEVFDATLLDKIRDKGAAERLTKLVEEARSLLADYNTRLAQELEDRQHISVILSNFTQNQRNALSLAEQKLNEYKEKLRKVVQVRNELKSHLQNLPDLSRLPSVTGLAPLPSACDLFNVARNVNSAGGSVTSSVSPNESMASPVDCGTPGSNTSL